MAINRISLGPVTEIISVSGDVDFEGAGITTRPFSILVRESDNALFRRDGANNRWQKYVTEKDLGTGVTVLGEPAQLDMSGGAATVTIATVAADTQAIITDVLITSDTAMTGTVETMALKIGTAGNSFNELLNGGTGHTFNAADPTSLISPGTGFFARELYPALTASASRQVFFNAGDVIAADLSGTAFTTGSIIVVLFGFVINGG